MPAHREKAGGVALPHAHVPEQQHGVQHVIEMRQRIVVRAEPAAAIDQEHDVLVALVLVLARDQLPRARSRFPVDLALRVAFAVFAQLVELESFTAARTLQHADLREPLVSREQCVLRKRREVGIDAYRRRRAEPETPLPKPERGAHAKLDRSEGELSARERLQLVLELRPRLRSDARALREAAHFAFRRMVVEHCHA
jgi:hypothetical protein